jgi:hypothetical protein
VSLMSQGTVNTVRLYGSLQTISNVIVSTQNTHILCVEFYFFFLFFFTQNNALLLNLQFQGTVNTVRLYGPP